MLSRILFEVLSRAGRQFGGIRPHRIMNSLGERGFPSAPRNREQFQWYKDRYGLWLNLHPFYYIDRNIIAFGAYDLQLNEFIAKEIRAGMTCLDVGANIGAISVHLGSCVGHQGAVHCFEPVPNVADRLQLHIQRNGFTDRAHVHRMALSNKTGETQMLIADQETSNQGMGSIVDTAELLNETLVASCMTLKDWAEKTSTNSIDFIKVDVQGAEIMFLEGAETVVNQLKPMLAMEVSPACLGATRVGSDELLQRLEDWGYKAWQLSKNGSLKNQITAKSCSPDFHAENIVFMPKQSSR